jgi:hypothetical protein
LRQQAGAHFQQRSLSAAARPDKTDELAGADVCIDRLQRDGRIAVGGEIGFACGTNAQHHLAARNGRIVVRF